MHIALATSMLVAILDGLGLTMFLPLMQAVDGGSTPNKGEMGDMRVVIDAMETIGLTPNLVTVLIMMLVFFLLKGVAKFGMEYYRVVLQQRFANKMRLDNMRLLAGYSYSEFSRADSGKIQNTFSGEISRINSAYRQYFLMLQYLIMTVVYVVLAYVSNPKFAIIVAVGGALSNLVFSQIYSTTKTASRKVSKEMNVFQGFLIESVSSFKFLKATDLISKYKQKIDQSIVDVEYQQRRIGVMTGIASAAREPLIIIVVVAAILIQVLYFQESLGLIILSLLFFYRALTYLVIMQSSYNAFLAVEGSIQNMKEFTHEMEESQEEEGEIPFNGLQQGYSVEKLSYSYPETQVLSELTFEVRRFETVGIVGESGTGKTTLVNLLCGLLPVDKGMIFVDGTDIADLEKHSFRRSIGYVTQEAQVFADTVKNNVSFWDADTGVKDEKVWQALRLAHADTFVQELPQGLDTIIGINGVNLSGGQRQRLSIARELYRNVDILILDEATSALDSQSELLIQENIDSLSGSLTIIVIAHRLSTIRNADKIVFLKQGGAYDIGTFSSLQHSSANFRKMVDLQTV
ncbi:ABC transporter ATP-binding protein [Neolewinella maritima]|uniref:ABC transporter ATP-binding protein n=1 Tax=Neolewinella maritima TaxID=1383882 RepID=UPI001EE7EF27|nr:ABC transporter ATP-binding protein [Neolewinella maritima]